MTDEPTPEPIQYDAPPTAALWDREMERLVGAFEPGRNVQDFKGWKDEMRRQYGHEPYGRLRRAVNLILTKTEDMPVPYVFGLFMRRAEQELAAEQSVALPAPDARPRSKKPAPEVLEWAFCTGLAKMRLAMEAPSTADVQAIWDERRLCHIPIGSLRLTAMGLPPVWKERGQ